jgi:tetratricopeptide (TPR) repeat protein/MinD-like ATPase involved in chromosome partitioning or flagellar assembly
MTGSVATFYSYKGGVGRSFALANTASRLCSWGARVLCLDWDLDAPGLHQYFCDWIEQPITGGLAEAFTVVQDGGELGLAQYVVPLQHPWTRGEIDFVAAGATSDDQYVKRIQRLDWARLYSEHDLGARLEKVRAEWFTRYDFVLIDSRTGITDIGGICTAHLPDVVVLVFTANEQSLRGVLDVAKRADVARDKLPYDLSRLLMLPVPSRFDAREEKLRADTWQARFTQELAPLVSPWLPRTVPVPTLIGHVTVPYVPYWSFGEEIAVQPDKRPIPGDVVYQLDVVAALLAHRLEKVELLAESRDLYLAAAARAARRLGQSFEYDAQLTYPANREKLTQQMLHVLRGAGLGVRAAASGVDTALSGGSIADTCRHLIAVLDQDSRSVRRDVEAFLRRAIDDDSERLVFPVLLDDASPSSLPMTGAAVEPMRLTDENVESLARELAAAIEIVTIRQRYQKEAGDRSDTTGGEATRREYVELVEQASKLALEQQAPDRAEGYIRQMLNDFSATGDASREAAPLRLLGAVAMARGDLSSAKAYYLDALDAARSSGAWPEQFADLLELASLSTRQSDYSSAQDYYQEALEVGQRLGQPQAVATVHRAFAQLLTLRGDRYGAQEHLEQALAVVNELGDHRGEALVVRELGDLAIKAGDLDAASEAYRHSLRIYNQLDDHEEVVAGYLRLGRTALARGDYQAADDNYVAAFEFAQGKNDAAGAGVALMQLAALAELRGQPDIARERYEQALALADRAGDPYSKWTSRVALARLLEEVGDLDGADMRYREALAIVSDVDDRRVEARVYELMGGFAQRRGRLDEAEAHYRKALSIRQRYPELRPIARIHLALGTLDVERGNLRSAERRLRDALQLFEGSQDREGVANTSVQLGSLAERAGDQDQAERLYRRALTIFEERQDSASVSGVRERLASLAEAQAPS